MASVAVAPSIASAQTTDTVTAIPALTGVGTTVALDAATVQALTSLGVKVAPYGTATLSGSDVTFPITSGYVEIHSDKGHEPGYIEGSSSTTARASPSPPAARPWTLSDFVVDPGELGALRQRQRDPRRHATPAARRPRREREQGRLG